MRPQLDLLELDHRARARGLPPRLATIVASVAGSASLAPERRDEVFEELVAHFEDGLAEGRAINDLLTEFGDPAQASELIADADRIPRSIGSSLPAPPAVTMLPLLLRETRVSIRRLFKSPGFAVTAILTLALGIGVMTSTFSLINAVVLRPWAIADVERVYDLYLSMGSSTQPLSNRDLRDLERGTRDAFTAAAGTRYARAQVGEGAETAPASVELVTGSYFDIVGLPPAMGRLLGPADDIAPNGHPVVVLSHRYWRRNFRGDSSVVGRTIRLNGRPYTIVGVASSEYLGNVRVLPPDITAPMMMVNALSPSDTDMLESWNHHGMFAKVRLRPGVTAAAAQVAVDRVAADLRQRRVGSWTSEGAGFRLVPTQDTVLMPEADPVLRRLSIALLVVVGVLMMVICANLAGFLLARGIDRRREIAIQLALGASRSRVLLPLLLEAMVLSGAGGIGGLVMTVGLTRVLAATELPLPIPVVLSAAPDFRVFAFGAMVAVMSGIAFGLGPALRATRPHLLGMLRDESGGVGGRTRGRLREALVVGQVAVCLVLVITASVLARRVQALRQIDPGFGRTPTAVLAVSFPTARYPTERRLTAIREVAERLRHVAGATHVGVVDNIHLNLMNTETMSVRRPEDDRAADRASIDVDRAAVDTGFFAAAGIPLIRGREFRAEDDDGTPVAIVNAALADRLWPGRDPIGRQLIADAPVQVIGVVRTAKIRSLAEAPRPVLYRPLSSRRAASVWYLVRTSGDADHQASASLAALKDYDAELVATTVTTAARHVGLRLLPVRLGAFLLASLAFVAVALAIVGLYSTVRYAVAQRSREVGVRMALGAKASAMVGMLAIDGIKLVGWGSALGIVLAAVVANGLSRLFDSGFDFVIFAIAPATLALLVGLAAWFPARRAATVPPAVALRHGGGG